MGLRHEYWKFELGGIQQLGGQNFAIFWPPPLLRGQFLYPEVGQKPTFFDPLSPPPSSCRRSYWMAPFDTYQSRQTGCCNCFSVTLLTHGTLWSSVKGHKPENQDETTKRYVRNGMTRNEHTVLVLESINARPEDNCAWKKATFIHLDFWAKTIYSPSILRTVVWSYDSTTKMLPSTGQSGAPS